MTYGAVFCLGFLMMIVFVVVVVVTVMGFAVILVAVVVVVSGAFHQADIEFDVGVNPPDQKPEGFFPDVPRLR